MPNQTFPLLHRRREEFGGEEELEVLDFFFSSEENCGASDEQDVRGREGGGRMAAPATGTARDRKEENETDEEEGKERDKTRECVRSFAAIASKVAVRRKRKGLDLTSRTSSSSSYHQTIEPSFFGASRAALCIVHGSYYGTTAGQALGGQNQKAKGSFPWLPQQKRGIPYPWGSRKGEGGRAATICLYALSEGGKGGGVHERNEGTGCQRRDEGSYSTPPLVPSLMPRGRRAEGA